MNGGYDLDDGPVMIDSCFRMMVQKLNRIQSKKSLSSSKKMMVNEVEKYNNNRFQIPVLKMLDLREGCI
jgi:hypothetical protein